MDNSMIPTDYNEHWTMDDFPPKGLSIGIWVSYNYRQTKSKIGKRWVKVRKIEVMV